MLFAAIYFILAGADTEISVTGILIDKVGSEGRCRHQPHLRNNCPSLRYSAFRQACPGVLTQPSMCVRLTTASKTCRCTLAPGRAESVTGWTVNNNQHPAKSLLSTQATKCIHPWVCKISGSGRKTFKFCTPYPPPISPLHIWHFCVQATLISGKQRSIEQPCLYSKHITDVFTLQLRQGQSCTLTCALKRRLCLKYRTRLPTAMQTSYFVPRKGDPLFRAGLKYMRGGIFM